MKKVKLILILAFVATFLAFKYSGTTVNSQTGISAPTGVLASDGRYANKVRVEWETIRDATLYRIFRGTTNNSATSSDIGITAANSFLDSTATAGQNFFYWIRAENGATISPLSVSDQGDRALAANQPGPIPPLEAPPVPAGNQITATKTYLGKALFWDEQLSSTKTVSCGTCHTAGKGGSDPRTQVGNLFSTNAGFDTLNGTADDIFASPGVPMSNADGTYFPSIMFGLREQVTGRKSPSHINAGYSPIQFWDGRVNGQFRDPLTNAIVLNNGGSLESQSAGPPVNDSEMAHSGRNWTDVATRVAASKPLALAPNVPTGLKTWVNNRTYSELFQEAFGTADVTPSRIALAIGTYERTLYSDQAPIDLDGSGVTRLTQQEQNGQALFAQTQCAVCHAGNLFTDNSFRNVGLRPAIEDTGRFQATGNQANIGEFKVPGLRNVELRGTFNHNGRFQTLEEVVDFYLRGGDFRNEPNFQGNLVRPRNLNAQQRLALIAFLKRPLTDPRVAAELPPFDRPTLYTQSNRVPTITGTGIVGSSGQIPQPTAIEPPMVGNPSFTVAVTKGLGGANAVLVINSTDPGTASIPTSGSFARQAISLQGSGAGNGYASISLAIPNNNALIGQTFFGRWYVTDSGSTSGFSVSPAFQFTIFGDAPAVVPSKYVDFDGDGKTDISIFRPSVGEWYYQRSSNSVVNGAQFGSSTDRTVPADYTGDGKTDLAFYRPSTGSWFILRSEDSSFYSFPFGVSTDIPTPGDFDGDGKGDVAVFRPSTGTWYISKSSGGVTIQPFGANNDRPVVADYDGDGKSDIAIFRPSVGEWYVLRSSDSQVRGAAFGISTDMTVQGDYTGDGKADFAFYRPSEGNWYVLRSEDFSYFASPFGVSTDTPTVGDYDGDGKFDQAVFRASTGIWYINRSSSGIQIQNFGATTDLPVPSYYLP
jgi:cytochrome c peroxidase